MTLPKLGIDIAKRSFDVALLCGEKLRHKKFDNAQAGFDALSAWLVKHGANQVHAVMEATGVYGEELASYLSEAGHRVSVVNPARIKAFGQSELQRNKTDRADAALIARFALRHEPVEWVPPPPELRQLQALTRHLEDLIEYRSQLSTRLTEGRQVAAVVNSLQAVTATLDEQITQIEHQIKEHLQRHPQLKSDCDLLTSIPGIGTKTAALLMAEVELLRNFKSARQAVAYAGLNPRHYESGTSVQGRTRLSKVGNGRVRKALYWPAITALQFNPIVRALGERLKKKGKCKMVVIGAAMRKLLHLVYGVLKSGRPFDPEFAESAE